MATNVTPPSVVGQHHCNSVIIPLVGVDAVTGVGGEEEEEEEEEVEEEEEEEEEDEEEDEEPLVPRPLSHT